MRATRIIADHGGNIARVSYNKAVDLYTLFLDIVAPEDSLQEIERELLEIGYIDEKITEIRVMEITIRIPDRPGAILPVLEILTGHDINISYLNSASGIEPWQDFRMGLLIENPAMIKTLLDEISKVYPVDIIQCDSSEENLDNTVFYIRLAGEMQALLGLDRAKTIRFITESNRILQALQTEGEDARKVFDYIKRFAHFVSSCRGESFQAKLEKITLSDSVTLYGIEPLFGSNTYVLDSPEGLLLIDTGYAIYAGEMLTLFRSLWPDFDKRRKKIYITHADVDHCGLLSQLSDAEIILNRKSAESLRRQWLGLPDSRENTELRAGYSRISRLISGYEPPDPARFTILDSDTPKEHSELLSIGSVSAGGFEFEILEGSGGHLNGELVYACAEAGLLFTGDLLVNIRGFSRETAEFNSLAPFLMKSVNIDSGKAANMRRQLQTLITEMERTVNRPCLLCGGHGPISRFVGGELTAYRPQ